MADPTSRIRAMKQEYNSNPNAWGGNLNTSVFDVFDEAFGVATITVNEDVILNVENYLSDDARRMVLVFVGTGGFTVTAPAVDKPYLVLNDCSEDVTLKPEGGTGAVIRAETIAWWFSDGATATVVDPTLDRIKEAEDDVAFGGYRLRSVGAGTASTDAATLSNKIHQFAAPTSALAMNSQKITGLASGTNSTDAVNRGQLDAIAGSATAAASSASAAASSASSASTSASNAATSASAASTSAGAASTSATNAANSATAAASSATSASGSATTATTQATNASNSASAAATSASNAATSASGASSSASSASTSATNAAASATAADASADAAAASQTAAASSASSASGSATSAGTSATNAATSATNAANSATAAAGSATSASGSATTATTQATNAAGSATTASTQATNAATSATNAANSATAASTSATNAATSETNAAASAAAAAASAGSMTTVEQQIVAAPAKTTPVDADSLGIVDSAASNALKELTFANLKAWVWAQFGALINGGTAKTTPVDADMFPIADSAASNATKKLTWGNIKTALSAIYAAINRTLNTQTGSTYTFVLDDAGKLVEGNRGTAQTFTVPPNSSVAFPTGTQIDLVQYGAGQITIAAGSGVTIRSKDSNLKLTGLYSAATLYKRGTNEWVLVGDLSA